MDERNQRATYDENGRLMSVISGTPIKNEKDGYKTVNALSVAFVALGVICIFAGWFIAMQSYDFNWAYFFGGIISAMFNFGWAAVTRVCALYMREHDK